jgi:hypothetical protein
MTQLTMTTETTERQRAYVEAQRAKGHGLGVVFADAFLRGMRDIGYKNPAWALAEQIDNAVQAAAKSISVRFAFDKKNKSQAKPDQLALLDDGNGMIPEMLGYAVRWGGTDREGDRHGFGRYGYGLPSSAVSMAKRYTVYSKTAEGSWHSVTVDIDELAAAASDIKRTEEILTATPAKLPKWLVDAEDKLDLKSLASGTIVVLEDLDRLRSLTGWITVKTLESKLLQHFGVIYRHWLGDRRLFVNGTRALPVDPLFLMEHGRFFDETEVRAIRVEARTFEVETSRGTTGTVTVRAALLPPNFQLKDPGGSGGATNNRFNIMKEYNGLLVCRERRQIDCVSPRWTTFQNYDRNIKVEIDFDPELDEYFGITTAKQQIVIADEMWEKLQHSGRGGGGLVDLVEDLRRRRDELRDELKAQTSSKEGKGEPRPSEVAMTETERFKGATPEPTPEQREEAERNLEREAKERAEASGKPQEEVVEELRQETARRRWEVEFAAIPEGPFYRPKRLGEQKRIILNTDHPFFAKVYDLAPEVRSALEVLLLVLAERELESSGDAEIFYKAERQRWSERLRHALDVLTTDEALTDRAAAMAEAMYANGGPGAPTGE